VKSNHINTNPESSNSNQKTKAPWTYEGKVFRLGRGFIAGIPVLLFFIALMVYGNVYDGVETSFLLFLAGILIAMVMRKASGGASFKLGTLAMAMTGFLCAITLYLSTFQIVAMNNQVDFLDVYRRVSFMDALGMSWFEMLVPGFYALFGIGISQTLAMRRGRIRDMLKPGNMVPNTVERED